ncbi:MAG: prepilin peptidase [DPANN group archaeon]|nr:prepilin peptidase [DPANN group archaeon]
MATDLVFASAAIIIVAIGTVTDFQNRWAPDYISYFGILFGLGGHAIITLQQNSYWPLLLSIGGGAAFYGIGWLMFNFGAWGGGDAKMLIALGTLLPVYQPITNIYYSAPWPFLVTLMLNILIFGAALGIIGTAIIFAKNFRAIVPEIKKQFSENKKYLYFSAGTIAVSPAFLFFTNIYFAAAVALAGFFIMLFFALKSVEISSMHKDVAPEKLIEGDWLLDEIKIDNFHVKPTKAGLETDEIKKIKELAAQGKIKTIRVKEGLPYLPAFLAALIASLFYGDLMLKIIMALAPGI